MYSPSRLIIEMRKADEEIEAAKRLGDLLGMQKGLARATSIIQIAFGRPPKIIDLPPGRVG